MSESAPGDLRFEFVDISNLIQEEPGHVNAIRLKQDEGGHLALIFTYDDQGKKSRWVLEL